MIRRLIEDIFCRAPTVCCTSPSGAVEVDVCSGWCGRWRIRIHGVEWNGHGRRSLQESLMDGTERYPRAREEVVAILRSPELPWSHAMR